MKIGFTGTQNGMSEKQKKVLFNLIESFPYAEYHHGDCIGADANFHTIVSDLIHETIGRIIIQININGTRVHKPILLCFSIEILSIFIHFNPMP